MAKTYEDIFPQVRSVLVEALGVDEDEVQSQSKLVQDLGAESIDFLDISFRLEKAFGIKIEQNEMFPENVLNDPAFVQGGKVTDAGMAELRQRLPHADLAEFEQSRSVEDFSNVFTVDAVVKFVQKKLG